MTTAVKSQEKMKDFWLGKNRNKIDDNDTNGTKKNRDNQDQEKKVNVEERNPW